MAAMLSSAEGETPPTNDIPGTNPATVEIRVIGEVAAREIATTTVNAQVTPFSSVPAQTSDQPLQLQTQTQQNECRQILTATPAPKPTAMSRSTTNTNIITYTNQVQETLPFRSPRSIAPSADPDGQTIQELRRTERVYH